MEHISVPSADQWWLHGQEALQYSSPHLVACTSVWSTGYLPISTIWASSQPTLGCKKQRKETIDLNLPKLHQFMKVLLQP